MFYITKNIETWFWNQVQILGPDDCWSWQSGLTAQGYGQLYIERKYYRSNIVAFYLTHKIYPTGVLIMHTCNNPPCCNSAHLIDGTNQENSDYKIATQRGFFPGAPKGSLHYKSLLTEADVLQIRKLAIIFTPLQISKMPEFKHKTSRQNIYKIVERKTWRHI